MKRLFPAEADFIVFRTHNTVHERFAPFGDVRASGRPRADVWLQSNWQHRREQGYDALSSTALLTTKHKNIAEHNFKTVPRKLRMVLPTERCPQTVQNKFVDV